MHLKEGIGALVGCGTLALLITYVVYLGKFAFSNPDNPCWYVTSSWHEPNLTGIAPIENEDGDIPDNYTDVHGHFLRWFKMFFWLHIASFATCCCSGCLAQKNKEVAMRCLGGCGFIAFITLFWIWIKGMVWRYSAAGHMASGDYLL